LFGVLRCAVTAILQIRQRWRPLVIVFSIADFQTQFSWPLFFGQRNLPIVPATAHIALPDQLPEWQGSITHRHVGNQP